MAVIVEKLLLAAPRGYCAEVDRALQTVERALELYGAPVYVHKEIVHNPPSPCSPSAASAHTYPHGEHLPTRCLRMSAAGR